MMNLYEFFTSVDEPYAAGLFEHPEKSLFYRFCNALSRWFDTAALPEYFSGERLYPDSKRIFDLNYAPRAVYPHYALVYDWRPEQLKEKCLKAGNPNAYEEFAAFKKLSHHVDGWTHGSPNYRRIIQEGLNSYEQRVINRPQHTQEQREFCEGLKLLLQSMRGFWSRAIAYLQSVNAPEELISACQTVPFMPAKSYYQGLVAWNAVFYFDGCDNLGCLDLGLEPLYRGEDLTDVLSELFENVNAVDMWSCTVGPKYNDITRQALRAIKGKRRPLLELRVTPDMPDDIWCLALENLTCNSTNPSFYNDKGIHDLLKERFPYIPDEELLYFCGGGCTETNLEGLTRAGGTDRSINLLKAFEEYLHRNLEKMPTFEDFLTGLLQYEQQVIDARLEKTQEIYRHRARYLPHPMRTLLFDDCIDKGRDYFNGGTRYSYSMNAEAGLINVIDSAYAVKKLYYDEKRYSAAVFLRLLKNEDEELFRLLRSCPSYGTDCDEVDSLGRVIAEAIFSVYRNKKPTLEFLDAFTVTEHQFSRYEYSGEEVGATPDGRHAHEPTCDSMAALRGKAVKGPTAMLCSAAKLPQHLVDGICVVNVTLSKGVFRNPELVKGLVLGYFEMGGIQLQITVTSPEELQDAMLHPEKHEDLLVRVGGYSEYFNRLSDTLKKTVLQRNIHELE